LKLFTLFAKHFHVQIAIGFDPVLVDFDGKRPDQPQGVRLRSGGVDFAGSPLVFPGRDGAPFSNQGYKQYGESVKKSGIKRPERETAGTNTSSRSLFRTLVRVCNKKCAPRGVHCICCFLTNRLLTT
jgi:hypothetical protein